MTQRPIIAVQRAASIFEKMLAVRRAYCSDDEYFKMSDFWRDLCDEGGMWRIKTYRSSERFETKPKAAVSGFAGRVTLTVSEKLMGDADRGCKLSNYILAHEAGHLELSHFNSSKKHFLLLGPEGTWNLPPTTEELEANLAGIFLQCGVALLGDCRSAVELANLAFTDVTSVKQAKRYVRLEAFQKFLNRPKQKVERAIL